LHLRTQVDHAGGGREGGQYAELDAILFVAGWRYFEALDEDAHDAAMGIGLGCQRDALERQRAGLEEGDGGAKLRGSFASGGYDHVVSTSSIGNPLSGRNAWGGTSNGYQDVVVNLPGVFNDVAVRWRMGTDAFAGGTGYSLDDVHLGYPITDRILSDGFECRPGPSCP
jgi:hypothetical protein